MGLNVSPSSLTLKASPSNKRPRRLLYQQQHDADVEEPEMIGSSDSTTHSQNDVNSDDDVLASSSSPPVTKRRRCSDLSSSSSSSRRPLPQKSVRFQPDDRLVEIKNVPNFLDLCDDDEMTSTTSTSTTATKISRTVEEIDYIKSTLWWTREEKRETTERNQLQSKALCQQRSLAVLSVQDIYQQICDADDMLRRSSSSSSSRYPYVVSSSSSSSSSDDDDDESSDSDDDDDQSDDCDSDSDESSKLLSPSSSISSSSSSSDDDEEEDDDELVQEGHGQMRVSPLPAVARGLEWGYLPASKAYRKTHVRSVMKWQQELSSKKTTGKKRRHRSSSSATAASILQRRTRASSRRSRLMARVLAENDHTDCATANNNSNVGMDQPRSPPLAIFPKPRLPLSKMMMTTTTARTAATTRGGTRTARHFVGRRLLPMNNNRPRMIPW